VSTLAVLGASGFTGRLVVAEALRQGHRPVLIGRDPDRIRRVLAADDTGEDVEVAGSLTPDVRAAEDRGPDTPDAPDAAALRAADLTDIRTADVTDPASLERALDGIDVLLTTVGPFDVLGRGVLDAALATGTHYVDVTGEQSFVHWAVTERDVPAREAGVVAVPAAGFEFLPGDLLAALAAGAVAWPSEVHVAYTIPRTGRFVRRSSAGTRRTFASMLGHRGLALVDEELVEELPLEARRLAWFPRPVGPRHAAGIPGGEALTVPRHVPGVRTVRTYVAMPTWQAELGQMGANLTRWAPARRSVQRLLQGGPVGPSVAVRASTRWGCVAESEGQDGVARAWAYGHDVYGLTAVSVVAVAEAILANDPPAGVQSPAVVSPPGDLLDEIAARCDLRWSVARPEGDTTS